MGARVSKGAVESTQKASSSIQRGARKYPTQPSSATTAAPSPAQTQTESRAPPPPQQPTVGPQVHSRVQASDVKSPEITADAQDPHFAASLRRLGAVQSPQPTLSRTSTYTPPTAFSRPNPAIQILQTRRALASKHEDEIEALGSKAFEGRSFLDAGSIRVILAMRERGIGVREIEREMRVREGVVGKLGPRGLVGNVEGRIGATDL